MGKKAATGRPTKEAAMFRIKAFATTTLALILCLVSVSTGQGQQQETEILWDTWGVPHIYASSEQQAFRAYGYAQMEAHGDLLLKFYAAARGRAAEVYGADFVGLDKATRTLGIPDRGGQWYTLQTPAFKANLDAFVAGINEYAAQHSDMLTAESESVLPVTGPDVMAHVARVFTQFLAVYTECFNLPELNIDAQPASNGWALGPQRTASGNAMLLVNPHLAWVDRFERFFEAQIVAPGVNFTGVTMVGLPVPVLGFDDHHGWTHTVNTADACDLYVLDVQGDQYVLDGQLRTFEMTTETLKVRQEDGSLDEEVITIRGTVHGPVFAIGGAMTAVRVNGVEINPIAGLPEQWWRMVRANTLDQFLTALGANQIPMLNTIYADKAKHTLLAYTSVIPVRSTGDYLFWNRPLPGDRSDLIWTETHPFDSLPRVVDPPSGFVQNSNATPWYMTMPGPNPDDFPPYFAPREMTATYSFAREQRGLKLLRQDDAFTFADLYAAKFDTLVETAGRVLGDLRRAARESDSALATAAADVLARWDRRSDRDSKGAALYFAFYATWIELTTARRQQADPDFVAYLDFFGGPDFFSNPWNPQHPLTTPHGLADPALALQALEIAAQLFQDAGAPLDIEWGALARFRSGSADQPGWGGGDPTGVFASMLFLPAPDGALQGYLGESFIALVEFGDQLQAKVLLAYGNSSRPDSPHNGDQVALLSNKQMRDPWRTKAEVLQHHERTVVLP
jgi:acyl-homoserine-lactone acylase